MTGTKPSREFVEECLKLADQFREDAERLLASGRLRSVVDRAYYAMFHASQAILASKRFEPKTHTGLRELFVTLSFKEFLFSIICVTSHIAARVTNLTVLPLQHFQNVLLEQALFL